jgi:hypothetical protein
VSARAFGRLAVFAALGLAAATARAADRYVAIILDTSGSMQENDPPRYTMQLSQVLSDLLEQQDHLSVIRMPDTQSSSCAEGASPSLMLTLDPADRAAFKRQLDGLVRYGGGTYFAAPIRTAMSVLPKDRGKQRLLLIIADAGGLGECSPELTRDLVELKQSGATIAAINLGGTAGAFDQNPAFDFTTAALDSQSLIEAVAKVYQRFLGARQVQTGRVQGAVTVEIAPYVQEAFLVVAADGPIRELSSAPGNPGAAEIDLNHRGGGETAGLDRRTRGYRIARLRRPAAGRWTFELPGLQDTAGWMLLQDSSLGLRLLSPADLPRGIEAPLEVELYDQATGQRVTDTARLPGLRVTLDVEGRPVTFRDDGAGGDRKAGDGILTGMARFDKPGEQTLLVHLESDLLDRTVAIPARVVDASWRLLVKTPPRAEVRKPVAVAVELQPIGAAGSLQPPERIEVQGGGAPLTLRDDGRDGDQRAGDRIYSRTWTPGQVGALQLEYAPVGGSPGTAVSAPLEVLGRLAFGPPVPVRLGRAHGGAEVAGRLDLGSAEVEGTFDARVSSPFALARTALEIDLGAGWVALGREPKALRLAAGSRRSWPVRLRVGTCPEGSPAGRVFDIVVEATAADGRALRTVVPLSVEVVPEPWLRCWWPVLAALLSLLIAGVLIHGYRSPSRFPPRLGVMISPEEDMSEGFFHPIHAARGSRRGFYRDAHVSIDQDYRLSGRPQNAVARLRADVRQVRIQCRSGGRPPRGNGSSCRLESRPPASAISTATTSGPCSSSCGMHKISDPKLRSCA